MKRRFSKSDIARMEAGQLPEPTEDEVQAVIIDGLRLRGLLVLVTSRRKKRCRKCGEWSAGGDGADKGLADLLVRLPVWLPGMWVSLEVKKEGPVRYSSPEQKALAASQAIIVVQCLEEALMAVWFKP